MAMQPLQFLAAPFRHTFRYRAVLGKTALAEIRGLYANSVFGIAWIVLGPLVLLALYTVIYVAVFRIRPASLSTEAYLVYVFGGLVPTIAFSAALSSGATALSANRAVLLNTVFPSELIPLRAVLVHSAGLPAGLVIIMTAATLLIGPSWAFAWVFVAIVLQLMFVTGVVWVMALVTLAFRDVQQLLSYVTLALLLVTPIAYTPDMIPSQLKILMYANPVYYFVAMYQYSLVYGTTPPWQVVLAGVVLAAVSFTGGFAIYQKLKTAFYDYV